MNVKTIREKITRVAENAQLLALEDMERKGIKEDEPHWLTLDGRALRVSEMTTRHIRNALAMLKRNDYMSPKMLKFYLHGPRPTGSSLTWATKKS